MVVLSRLESGTWVKWRVGRRRLAWRPGASVLRLLEFAQDPFTFFVLVPVLGWWLLSWIAALLATAVVWPVRAISGRWLVVAYMLGGDEHEPRYRWVRGRQAADLTVRQWRRDIEEHGRPAVSGEAATQER